MYNSVQEEGKVGINAVTEGWAGRRLPWPLIRVVPARVFCAAAVALSVTWGCGSSHDHITNLDAPGEVIVCLGDSITQGHGATPGKDYPSQLAAMLGRRVVNAGRDGDTTESALARLERDVLSHKPRLVIIELGGNDFLQRKPKDKTLANLDRIVSSCTDAGAMVAVVHFKCGILLSDPYLDGYKATAKRHGAAFVPRALKNIFGRPGRMTDPIHPNDDGYALFAARVAAVVGPLLESADTRRARGSP
ncbi:MAG TPA: arylesterase [Candidatus Hydrogenedentes bacterium]|nr:arylesterase [Candidatus Hydrogenedentota bacterium]